MQTRFTWRTTRELLNYIKIESIDRGITASLFLEVLVEIYKNENLEKAFKKYLEIRQSKEN